MFKLSLFRHAKSSWKDSALADFDRPLNGRGIRAAKAMGDLLNREHMLPEFVLCSSAARAKETYQCLSLVWPPEIRVKYERSLYLASPDGILRYVARIPENFTHAMVIGHNPGLHRLATKLTFGGDAQAIENLQAKFPTAALAMIELQGESWRSIEPTTGRLRRFLLPRELR
ncbi:MAG: histidine phosphatase family protein [Alphaproteobacteria bacterium]|nr:histidine phosphatase family protein [Alphaproteobacteria bacterium]